MQEHLFKELRSYNKIYLAASTLFVKRKDRKQHDYKKSFMPKAKGCVK
jgi:hypothetical protein